MPADPLVHLGFDIFTLILTFLPVRDLARAELVHSTWFACSSSNRRLWKDMCLATGVDEVDLIPAKHWYVPSYRGGLLEADWRASCLRACAAAVARAEGRFTLKHVPSRGFVLRSISHEAGDDWLMGIEGGWETCEGGDAEDIHTNQLITFNTKTGRKMSSLDLPNTECGVFFGGSGYALFYEHRSPNTKGHNPMIWRTHSKGGRLRKGEDKTSATPKHGGFEFLCDLPALRNPFTMRLRVDREGQEDAEAILYAIHPGLVRICYLEDDMRMERFRIDPELNANEVFMDDDYIFVMGSTEDEDSYPYGFSVYSRATKELVLNLPSLALIQHSDNTFLLALDNLEDQSHPARWGGMPEEVSFATASKNKRRLGFPDSDGYRCVQWENEVAFAGDDLVFTEACDLYVWKRYRAALVKILRNRVTCPIQRGRWFASLSLCIQAPTNQFGYHDCLKAWHAIKHHVVCVFERCVLSIDLRTISASARPRPDKITTVVLQSRTYMDYMTYVTTTPSQVIWTNFSGRTVLTFGFNDRW